MSTDFYLWSKVVHVISVMAWMTALWYQPRLMVYQSAANTRQGDHPDQEQTQEQKTLALMHKRLARIIALPAMTLTWITGISLLSQIGSTGGWIHMKITLVLGLSVLQMIYGSWRRQLTENRCRRSQRFFRLINEIPTLLVILIVSLVILKPF